MKATSLVMILAILAIILAACSNAQVSKPAAQTGFIKPTQAFGGFYKVREDPVLLNNKPVVIFIGAGFCPFCATQRWSTVEALSRFGTFTGLKEELSSGNPGDGPHSGIATYDWTDATYTSDYITFDAKEIADRDGKPLQQLTDFEKQFVDRLNPRGSIPFQIVAGKYARIGPAFDPSALQGKSFEEIKAELANHKSDLAADINQDADVMTALICTVTDNQPAKVCSNPAVKAYLS